MRVISYGVKWPTRVQCDKCKSVLEYMPYDMCMSGIRFARKYYIKCEVCRNKIIIEAPKLPKEDT